jgi:phage FluMu protein gp41
MNITLTEGYTDSKGVTHRDVTFGKRYDGATMFALDEDPQGDIPTQYQLLIVRTTITAFGMLSMPATLEQLLKLDTTDIRDLVDAHNKFMVESLEGRAPEFISESKVKLALGYESNGVVYNIVEFGNRLNGYDWVEADKTGFKSLRREYFLIGREITKLSTEDGKLSLDGPAEVQIFEKLDAEDFVTMRVAAVRWRESFRTRRSTVQKDTERRSADSGSQNKVERSGDSVAPE